MYIKQLVLTRPLFRVTLSSRRPAESRSHVATEVGDITITDLGQGKLRLVCANWPSSSQSLTRHMTSRASSYDTNANLIIYYLTNM